MENWVRRIKFCLRKYLKDQHGVSATEAAILFPVLMSLLMAVYDVGQGIVVNQKTVAASQVIADLLARNEVVDIDIIDDVVIAGEMALEPYPTDSFGYDITSVEFDEDGEPEILWRVTENMTEDEDAVESTEGLGEEGDGVVVVSVVYQYVPFFSNFVVDQIDMRERAFLRGRQSATIPCTDCP
ncbi:MAG: pilus assembly protein [Alphaproteobacteria bacterium]|nr:pilus assembly protein [Alphaproteobacteria bacterium]